MTPKTDQTDPDYIPTIVKDYDRDRYIAALFTPEPYRTDLMSLFAFNVELARIPELVSEPALGEIRLQWWRDALRQLEGGARLGHPVADRFGDVMRRRKLPKMTLLGLIDARNFDVTGDVMPDMQALRSYLAKTAGALFALSAEILADNMRETVVDAKTKSAVAEAARAGGIAYGFTGLMRALPIHVARGRLFLPVSHFDDFGVDRTELMRGEENTALKEAFSALIDEARVSLDEARRLISELPKTVRPAFLPLTFLAPYLDKLGRSGHRPLHDLVEINPLGRLYRAWHGGRRVSVVCRVGDLSLQSP